MAAGEASGDRLAASLVAELRRRNPGLVVRGLAGPAMRRAGVAAAARSEDATAIGLVEVISALPRLVALVHRMVDDVIRFQPDVVVTVDSPDLLLRLGRRLRERGFCVIHWVAPQVWAWRAHRLRRLAGAADLVMCLFPFEVPKLQPHVSAAFTGHPAAAIRPAFGPAGPRRKVALMPGSRPSEVGRLWPVLREVARRIRTRWPDAELMVARAPTIPSATLAGLDATVVEGIAACRYADVAIVASGTATLELAALRVPMVVIYRLHPITWELAKRLVRVSHIALPNLLASEPCVPEVLQSLDPCTIAEAAFGVAGQRDQVPSSVVERLQGATAVARAADLVQTWPRQRTAEYRG